MHHAKTPKLGSMQVHIFTVSWMDTGGEGMTTYKHFQMQGCIWVRRACFRLVKWLLLWWGTPGPIGDVAPP
jgi:hypothetical protein